MAAAKAPLRIRPYRASDFPDLVRCMEDFQDYIMQVDRFGRYRRLPGYGRAYTRALLKNVKASQGVLLLALSGSKLAGMIAGVILPDLSRLKLLEFHPFKRGKILELFLYPEFRDQGLGAKLMRQMEIYFRKQRCDSVCLDVLPSNTEARGFYQKAGYQEFDIDLIKFFR